MSSGYSTKYRAEIVIAGIKGYENQCKRADSGEVPLHRPRDFNRQERIKKKALAKTSWYKPSDTVNIKVKVVETSGQSLTRQLFKTNTSDCLIPDCPV